MSSLFPLAKNSTLAYIVGVAIGDGNLSNPNGRAVRLRISCDTKYPKLIKKICASIQALLPRNKVTLVKKKVSSCLDVSCYSNKWPTLLGWSVGAKFTQDVGIPAWIKHSDKYSIHCLRGLIETDGAVYRDRGYLCIIFTSTIKKLAIETKNLMEKLGFKPHLYIHRPKQDHQRHTRYNVRLTKDAQKFIEPIGIRKE